MTQITKVGIDLIYEGITTRTPQTLPVWANHAHVGIDLIYEGITTIGKILPLRGKQQGVGIDLIYEGITTIFCNADSVIIAASRN